MKTNHDGGRMMPTFIFGHKNPDTDSVASAIAYAYLRNQLNHSAFPGVLGNINLETKFVLKYFNVHTPAYIKNVKTQIRDLNIDHISGISSDCSIFTAYTIMENTNFHTLAVLENEKIIGIITMTDIAIALIKEDYYTLSTSLKNIADAFKGEILSDCTTDVNGKIVVLAYDYESTKDLLQENMIAIVGNRYDIIEHAITSKVALIIITGGNTLSPEHLKMAKSTGVPIISVPTDTYTTAKLLNKCNSISTIMHTENIVSFSTNDYLQDIMDEVLKTNYRNYPVVNKHNAFIGFINRKHMLNPGKKKVILVDHNEYNQSVDGLDEAEIIEMIDHHKIGDISTNIPICFKNMPVGSTCTIIYQMFKEQNVEIPYDIAGLLLSGIISDTLFLKSPTTTELDRRSITELNMILKLNLQEYSTKMFKAGTTLEGQTIKEIFYKDFKEFKLDQYNIGISQIFTLDLDSIFNQKYDFITYINKIQDSENYYAVFLLVTDILKEGSYLFFKCKNNHLVSTAFQVDVTQGIFLEDIVSRKKQVIPRIMDAINLLR